MDFIDVEDFNKDADSNINAASTKNKFTSAGMPKDEVSFLPIRMTAGLSEPAYILAARLGNAEMAASILDMESKKQEAIDESSPYYQSVMMANLISEIEATRMNNQPADHENQPLIGAYAYPFMKEKNDSK